MSLISEIRWDWNVACRAVMISSGSSIPLMDLLNFGHSLSEMVRKAGGRARCFRTPGAVWVEQAGIGLETFRSIAEMHAQVMAQMKATIQFVVQSIESPHVDLDEPGILPNEYSRTKLTKKLIYSLPAGAFVVSNIRMNEEGPPCFASRIAKLNRSFVWEQAKGLGAAQRTCDIFWNTDDVREVYGIEI